jgi:hypothetical protein
LFTVRVSPAEGLGEELLGLFLLGLGEIRNA